MIDADPVKYGYLAAVVESPEFTGHVIWALANDPALAELNGQTLIGAELAVKYGIKDAGGNSPPATATASGSLRKCGTSGLSANA